MLGGHYIWILHQDHHNTFTPNPFDLVQTNSDAFASGSEL